MTELTTYPVRALVYLAGDPTPIRTRLTDVEVAHVLAEGASAAASRRQQDDEYFVALPLKWEGLDARVRPRYVSCIVPFVEL